MFRLSGETQSYVVRKLTDWRRNLRKLSQRKDSIEVNALIVRMRCHSHCRRAKFSQNFGPKLFEFTKRQIADSLQQLRLVASRELRRFDGLIISRLNKA